MSAQLAPGAREQSTTLAEGRHVSLHPPLRRVLAALVLPASLIPVALLAPSLVRAPATLWRHTAHALAPAHAKVHHAPPPGPRYFLVGAARLEVEAYAGGAGVLTPRVGISPFAEPEWAARSAAENTRGHGAPIVLIARGRELTDASGRPLGAASGRATPTPSQPRVGMR